MPKVTVQPDGHNHGKLVTVVLIRGRITVYVSKFAHMMYVIHYLQTQDIDLKRDDPDYSMQPHIYHGDIANRRIWCGVFAVYCCAYTKY